MLCGLAAELALGREKLLDVRVCPHALRDSGIDGRQRLPRQAAVTVDLLEQPLRARDAVLRDGVIAARGDTLQPVRLWKNRGVLQRGNGELLQLRNRML